MLEEFKTLFFLQIFQYLSEIFYSVYIPKYPTTIRDRWDQLEIVLFEVELIINNAPLTYVYPNTIETCLTPNHLLFGRQLLYSSNTPSTVAAKLTVLLNTTDNTNRISNHFWDRWKHEYVVNLREIQQISK